MGPNPQETVDLVTFTEEILGEFQFENTYQDLLHIPTLYFI